MITDISCSYSSTLLHCRLLIDDCIRRSNSMICVTLSDSNLKLSLSNERLLWSNLQYVPILKYIEYVH